MKDSKYLFAEMDLAACLIATIGAHACTVASKSVNSNATAIAGNVADEIEEALDKLETGDLRLAAACMIANRELHHAMMSAPGDALPAAGPSLPGNLMRVLDDATRTVRAWMDVIYDKNGEDD